MDRNIFTNIYQNSLFQVQVQMCTNICKLYICSRLETLSLDYKNCARLPKINIDLGENFIEITSVKNRKKLMLS